NAARTCPYDTACGHAGLFASLLLRIGRRLFQQCLSLAPEVLQLKLLCLVGWRILLRNLHRLIQPLARLGDLAESDERDCKAEEMPGLRRPQVTKALKVERGGEPVIGPLHRPGLEAVPGREAGGEGPAPFGARGRNVGRSL